MDNEVGKLSKQMLKFVDKVDEDLYKFMGATILAYRTDKEYKASKDDFTHRTVKVWFQKNHLHISIRTKREECNKYTEFNVTRCGDGGIKCWTQVDSFKNFDEDIKLANKIVRDALKKTDWMIKSEIIREMDEKLWEDLYVNDRK